MHHLDCMESTDADVVDTCIFTAKPDDLRRYNNQRNTTTMPISTPYSGSKPPQWTTQDLIDSAKSTFVASALGRTSGADLHPLTLGDLAQGPSGLLTLARNIGTATGRPLKHESGNEIMALALGTDHLPDAIMQAASAVVRARTSPLLTAVRMVTADLQVRDYREQPNATVDIQLAMPDEGSTGRFLMILPQLSDQPIKLHSTFAKLALSIQALTADDFNLVPSLVTAFISAAAKAEAAELARLLEANALPDGTAWFTGDNTTTAALDLAAGLGKAAGLLRAQKTETGERSGEPIKTIIVNGDDEITALAVVEQLPKDRRPRVAVLPHLADTAWYAVADPQSCPAIGRVRMQGSDPSALSFSSISEPKWRADNGELRDIPGIALDAQHTVGLSPLSRVGIVKLAKP